MKPALLRLATVGSVGATLAAAGGLQNLEVLGLAAISGGVFAGLAGRAAGEDMGGAGDVTDLVMPLGFLVVLLAAAYDAGRGSRAMLSPLLGTAFWLTGVTLIVAGVWLRRSALRHLGSSYSVRLEARGEHRLVRSGPYRWIRHPNYTALLLVALGTAVSLASAWALAATLIVWLPILGLRVAREEESLRARFGDPYAKYCRRTWRLAPGLY
jgi:protein-S-isoprenylcysteine O-methyltransferase Ste14